MTEPWHGTLGGYNNYRCRCQPCKDAHNAYYRKYTPRYRRERRKHDPMLSHTGSIICCGGNVCTMPDAKFHGTLGGYTNHNCRCRPCTDAANTYQRGYSPRNRRRRNI